MKITNQIPVSPFIEIPVVDSTNNYAMAQLKHGNVISGTCYFAHAQIAGIGQRGKLWESQPGCNIAMTKVIDASEFNLE